MHSRVSRGTNFKNFSAQCQPWWRLHRFVLCTGLAKKTLVTELVVKKVALSFRNCLITIKFLGYKAKGWISKQVLQENKAHQIFRKTNISYPMIRTHAWHALFFCNTRFEICLNACKLIIIFCIDIVTLHLIHLSRKQSDKQHCDFYRSPVVDLYKLYILLW